MKNLVLFAICFMFIVTINAQAAGNKNPPFRLIAHRGGVVDSTIAENSMAALKGAAAAGYWMVEIDVRTTKDGELVTNHDANLKRYYGIDKKITDMNWDEINKLQSPSGAKVLKLEEVFAFCSGKLQVMIDNKIKGNDTSLFNRMLALLKKYKLNAEAMMIGTDESTEFFTGKIKLSCTRKQLEENMQKPGYKPANYYLFASDITSNDVSWAKANNILAVGVVNAWAYKQKDVDTVAKQDAERLINTGATCFQIDSEFAEYFR